MVKRIKYNTNVHTGNKHIHNKNQSKGASSTEKERGERREEKRGRKGMLGKLWLIIGKNCVV